MNKAIFLDRDGVIISEQGRYNYLPAHIEFNEGISDALTKFQQSGYLLIMITNQAGIDKDIYTHQHVKTIHKIIRGFLKTYGVTLTDIFYCPHHPTKTNCICRKPGSAMLEKAIALYQINPLQSYFIGDTDRDSEAAIAAGINPVKIEPNQNINEIADNIIKGSLSVNDFTI